MKRPDEIKKGMNDALPDHVHFHKGDPEPHLTHFNYHALECLHADAIAYIQRIEAQNAEQAEIIRELNAQIGEANKNLDYWQAKLDKKIDSVEVGVVQLIQYCKELQAERDAAVGELVGTCEVCRWEETGKCASCHFNVDAWNAHESNWEWRGIQKEGEV